ncbi:hypothetical protein HDU98_010294 [Podochytrium sp. JEL0797]|nr:hypothetical protein HDU98_010294 [Podochytrium sp. JEL0797]
MSSSKPIPLNRSDSERSARSTKSVKSIKSNKSAQLASASAKPKFSALDSSRSAWASKKPGLRSGGGGPPESRSRSASRSRAAVPSIDSSIVSSPRRGRIPDSSDSDNDDAKSPTSPQSPLSLPSPVSKSSTNRYYNSDEDDEHSDLEDLAPRSPSLASPKSAGSTKPIKSHTATPKKLSALDSSRTAWANKKPNTRAGVKSMDSSGTGDDPSDSVMAKLEGKSGTGRRPQRRVSVDRNSSDLDAVWNMEEKLAEKKAAVEKQRLLRKEKEQQDFVDRERLEQDQINKQRAQEREQQAAEALAAALSRSQDRDSTPPPPPPPAVRSLSKSRNPASSRETSPASTRSNSKPRRDLSPDAPTSSTTSKRSQSKPRPQQQQQALSPKPKYAPIVPTPRPLSTVTSSSFDSDAPAHAPPPPPPISRSRPPRGPESTSASIPKTRAPRAAMTTTTHPDPIRSPATSPTRNPRHSSLSINSFGSLNSLLRRSMEVESQQQQQQQQSKTRRPRSVSLAPSAVESVVVPAPVVVIKKFNWASAAKKLEATAAAAAASSPQQQDPVKSEPEEVSPAPPVMVTASVAPASPREIDPDSSSSDSEKGETATTTAASTATTPPPTTRRVLPPRKISLRVSTSSSIPRERSLPPPPPPVLSPKEKSLASSARAKKIIPSVVEREEARHRREAEQKEMWEVLELEMQQQEEPALVVVVEEPKSPAPTSTNSRNELKTLFDDLEKQANWLQVTGDHKRKSRAAMSKVASMAESLKKSVMEEEMWRLLEAETVALESSFKKVGKVTEVERWKRMEERAVRKLGRLEDKLREAEEMVVRFDEALRRREAGEDAGGKVESAKTSEVKPSLLASLFKRNPSNSDPAMTPVKEGVVPPQQPPLARSNSKKSIKSMEDEKPTGSPMSRNPSEKSVTSTTTPQEDTPPPDTAVSDKPRFFGKLWNRGDPAKDTPSPTASPSGTGSSPVLPSTVMATTPTTAGALEPVKPLAGPAVAAGGALKSAPSSSSLKTVATIPSVKPSGVHHQQPTAPKLSDAVPPQTTTPIPSSSTPLPTNDATALNTPGEKKTVLGWLFGKKKDGSPAAVQVDGGAATAASPMGSQPVTPDPLAMTKTPSSDGESVTSSRGGAAERSAERRRKWAEMKNAAALNGSEVAGAGATGLVSSSPLPGPFPGTGLSLEERRLQWMARKQSDAGVVGEGVSRVGTPVGGEERVARRKRSDAVEGEFGVRSPAGTRSPSRRRE